MTDADKITIIMIVTVTHRAKSVLTKELNMNKISYQFGKSLWEIIVESSPKVDMAIRMTKERCGLQCLNVKK